MIMLLFLKLALFLTGLSCVQAEIVLTQSGSEIKKPGENARLQCPVSGFNINSYWMHWVRQAPGKGLEWVASYYSAGSPLHYTSDAVKGRFTASTEGSTFSLQMNSLKTEDSGVYYCARYNYYFDVWGPGTSVTVTAVSSRAPSLYPLISCGASQNPVPIGCLAKDFLPDPVTFSWTDKNNASFTGGLRTYPSVLRSGGTYSASSGVEVPLTSWNKGDPFYCKATHSALGQPLVKKLDKPVQKLIPPIVTLHPPINEDIEKGNATIVCMCRGFYPDTIKVSWLKDGMKVTSGVHTKGPVANSAGDFDLTSSLDITAADWNRNSLYSCFVDHAVSNYWNSKNISKSLLCGATSTGPATIEVSTVAPTFEEVFIGKSAKLTCIVTNMVNYESLNITWTDLTKKAVIKTVITDAVLNNKGTYSAMGIASACAEDWIEGHKFECKVLHDELASQTTAYLQKENGTPASKPVVYVYPPTTEELALKEHVTIVALIKRYNPCDVMVKWLREKDEVPKVDYVNTKPIEELDPTTEQRTCLLYSTLRVTESDWNSGTVFTCVVGHETLPMQLTQKSIDKTVGKPTYINVSLVMSDAASTCY